MNQPYLFVLALLVVAALAVVLAIYIGRRRAQRGAWPLVFLLLAVFVWSAAYALELASKDLPTKLLWAKVQYFGIATIASAWFVFAIQYSGRRNWFTRSLRNLSTLAIMPILTLISVWTNEAHGLIWSQTSLSTATAFPLLDLEYGRGFWVFWAYTYLLLTVGSIWIALMALHSIRLFRLQAGVMLAGVLAPWIANLLYVARLVPTRLDLTPFAFFVAAVAYAWSLFHAHLLDVVPVARRAVISGLSECFIVCDLENRIVDANPAAQRLTGRGAGKLIGQPVRGVLGPHAALLEKCNSEQPVQAQIAMTVAGVQYCFDARITRLLGPLDQIIGRLIVLYDITALKQAERELADTKALLEAAFAQTPIPMGLITVPDGVIQIVNPALVAYLGIEDEPSPVGARLADLDRSWVDVDPEDNPVPPDQTPIAQAMAGATTHSLEQGVLRKDGTRRCALVSATPIHNLEGEQIAAHLAFPDITALRQTQAEVRKLAVAFEHSPGTIMITDRQGSIQYVNPAFARITGYAVAEAIGRNPRMLSSGHHPPELFRELWATILSGREWRGELRNRKKNGELYWEHTVIAPITGPNGTITHFVAIKEDVTARKQAEEELQRIKEGLEMRVTEQTAALTEVNLQLRDELELRKRAEQMTRDREAMMRALAWQLDQVREWEREELARELHDQLGRNLTVLDLYLNTIRAQCPRTQPNAAEIQARIDASLALVAQMGERIRDLMADLRPPALDDMGLVAALEWHVGRRAADYDFAVSVEGQEPDPPLPTPVALALFRIAQEALHNVSKHARASQVTVAVESVPEDQSVRLVVTDDGTGFDVGARKRPVGGYHWGLIIMTERAEAVGGRCHVESEPGHGTRVVVEAPR